MTLLRAPTRRTPNDRSPPLSRTFLRAAAAVAGTTLAVGTVVAGSASAAPSPDGGNTVRGADDKWLPARP